MITPIDIQNKEFPKGVSGYKKEDVDGFLDLVTLDLEKLIAENKNLKEDVERLSRELQKYKSSEDAVLETLEAAKALMGDISSSAEKRAEILLKNAELDAELIQREARESVDRLMEESINLRNRFTSFQSKYRNLLEAELERFDTLSNELFAEFGDWTELSDDKQRETKATRIPLTTKNVDMGKTTVMKAIRTDDDLSKTMINIRIDE